MSTDRIHIDQFHNETGKKVMLHGVLKVLPEVKIYDSSFESPIQLGRNTIVGPDVQAGAYFGMSDDCYIARAKVGRYVSIGRRVAINPFGHPVDWLSTAEFQYHRVSWDWIADYNLIEKLPRSSLFKYVTIGNDVWMGHNVNIMGNNTIGDGAIIAAGAVITRDVPPYAIVGGVPAKLIRYRFSEGIIERLLRVRWWDMPLIRLKNLPFNEIERCLDRLEEMRRVDDSLG